MKRLCLILAASLGILMLTPSAHALSCMPPDVERELTEAMESDKVYHIFVGYFIAPERPKNQLPGYLYNGGMVFEPADSSETVNGHFTGFSMGKTRAQDSQLENFPVQIKISCSASWCGQEPRRDQKLIAFVEAQEGGPPLLTRYACPYMSHDYSDDKVRTLRRGL